MINGHYLDQLVRLDDVRLDESFRARVRKERKQRRRRAGGL
jgi:hypothetical protein